MAVMVRAGGKQENERGRELGRKECMEAAMGSRERAS